MQKYKWISECGNCKAADIKTLMISKIGEAQTDYIALLTNKFDSGHYSVARIDELNLDNLLEVRVFNDKSEFLATRGSVGSSFSWRITDDSKLDNMDVIISRQFIDINGDFKFTNNEIEGKKLISTVGGKYSLPIDEKQKRIKIKSYINYDKNGMAKIIDSRVCCFTE